MSVVYGTPTPKASSASGIEESLAGVKKAAQDQMAWNRPNTANPWAAQTNNPDGSVSLGFTGPLQGAQTNLMAQALRNMGSPLDSSQFNTGTGDEFRQQAIGNAQSQMGDWLAPLQAGFGDAQKQRLLDAGYSEGSPQFAKAMGGGAASAQDLQSTLGNAAIGLGSEHGAQLQGMDILSKQQGLAEALRQRSLPMEQLGIMQGLSRQDDVAADDSIMGGATSDFDQAMNEYWGARQQYEAQNKADQEGGLGMGLGLFQTAATLGMNGMGSKSPKPSPKPSGGHPMGKGPVRSI